MKCLFQSLGDTVVTLFPRASRSFVSVGILSPICSSEWVFDVAMQKLGNGSLNSDAERSAAEKEVRNPIRPRNGPNVKNRV